MNDQKSFINEALDIINNGGDEFEVINKLVKTCLNLPDINNYIISNIDKYIKLFPAFDLNQLGHSLVPTSEENYYENYYIVYSCTKCNNKFYSLRIKESINFVMKPNTIGIFDLIKDSNKLLKEYDLADLSERVFALSCDEYLVKEIIE